MNRPTVVTVFGILNIVFGLFGVLGLMAAVALFFVPGESNNPVIHILHENPTYAAYVKISIPLGLLSLAALLVAGIGLLLMKPWARLLSLGYAIYAVVFGLIGVAINFLFIVRPMLEQAQHQPGPDAGASIGAAVGSGAGGCFGLVYPVLLIIFMTRAKVVAAFRRPD